PFSCTGVPSSATSCVPSTRSWPYKATGVPSGAVSGRGSAVTVVVPRSPVLFEERGVSSRVAVPWAQLDRTGRRRASGKSRLCMSAEGTFVERRRVGGRRRGYGAVEAGESREVIYLQRVG